MEKVKVYEEEKEKQKERRRGEGNSGEKLKLHILHWYSVSWKASPSLKLLYECSSQGVQVLVGIQFENHSSKLKAACFLLHFPMSSDFLTE